MEYKDRLKAARKHASLTQGQLAEAIGITQTSISDLERGKSKGTTFNARIAKVCGVSALWLEDGIGEMLPKDGHSNVAPAIQPHRPQRKYPVLSEVPAGHPRESVAYLPQHAEEHYPSTENAGPNGYWLKVEGPSMTSTSHPSFPEGTLILVQPEGFDLISGKYYIAQHRAADGAITATFKKYIKDCGNEYLVPLNPEFDTIRMDHDWDIIGRVIDIRIKDL